MKRKQLLIIVFCLLSTVAFSQSSTNPVYLNYNSNLDWSTYISATGSSGNQPSMFFHLPYVGTTGNAVFEWDADDSGTRKAVYRFEASSDRIFEINGWSDGSSSDLWFGDDNNNKFYISDDGDVGIGTLTPQERFHVASGGNMRLDNQGRYFITRSNVTSEMFTATNGQGSGWMINATYGGSGNPQSNSTFSIEPGQHNTAAGYLDFDGNSKNWSFNLSATSTGIGNTVSWKRVAFFDDSEITLSPTGSSTHFNIRSNGNVGIGTDNATRLLHVNGSTTDVVSAFESTDSGTQIVLTDNSGSLRLGTLSNGGFALSVGGDSSSTTGANVAEAMRVTSVGNVGIGESVPDELLHISSGTTGDAVLKLESDTDNTFEGDNSRIEMLQDAGSMGAYIGFDQDWSGGGTQSDNLFRIVPRRSNTNVEDAFIIKTEGSTGDIQSYIGIGTADPTNALEVNGTVRSKEVVVEATSWPDYVFSPEYKLLSLEEIEAHIESKGHLPEVPSAQEVEEEGQHLGEMQQLLLKKIEEMTLHLIDLKKENEALKERVTQLEQTNNDK